LNVVVLWLVIGHHDSTTSLSIVAFSIKTLSIKSLYVTLCISNTQHK
jgi:hypothetical protein